MGERWHWICVGCMYNKMGTIGANSNEYEKSV